MFDTIAAISAGFVNEPISIIRLSGPDAFNIARKVYDGKIGIHRKISHGRVWEGKALVDEVLAASFCGPHSYTGEDIVEINAHGGVANTARILRLLLANGARAAERGEFSRRAFLNGKLDLVKAEAIHDLIFAPTEAAAALHVQKFDGKTSDLIASLQSKLLTIIATIETNIDYPEYDDITVLTNKNLLPALVDVRQDLLSIKTTSVRSRYLYEGIKVAIVGKPNVGKSSLLNVLINENKAIVSSEPGTTRDIVEGRVQLGSLLLLIQDTAGIRQSKNEIEQFGISKALAAIKQADLIVHVIDATAKYDAEDELLKQSARIKNYIQVFNKADLQKGRGINISVKQKQIEPLLTAIQKTYPDLNLNHDYLVTNTRQLSYIDAALVSINEAIEALEVGVEPSIVIIDIRAAWEALASILGRADQTDLLDLMFKHFCLGK